MMVARLARRWGVTPAAVRAQTAADVAAMLDVLDAEAKAERRARARAAARRRSGH